jgi:UDP:flavonoid glycosyltransferase YjiC (YdhE family)
VRVLVTVQPAAGHLRSLVPLARVLRCAGHRVAVAAPPAFHPEVRSYGLDAVAAGAGWTEQEASAWAAVLRHPERPWRWEDVYWHRLDAARSVAGDLLALASEWRPDLVVRDCTEFGGAWAAELLGVPHVPVGTAAGIATLYAMPELARRLDAGRAALGLPPDPELRAPNRHLYVHLTPPCFDPAELALPNVRCCRPAAPARAGEALPSWLAELPAGRPLVLASLGTAFHGAAGRLEAIAAGLAGVDCQAVVATGSGPAGLGRPPAHVHLVEAVPQPLLLQCADLLVTHGGINSIREALSAGVPMVVAPVATDQPGNARRCESLGVARALPAGDVHPAAVAAACREVLSEGRFRARARAVQREVLALPPLESLLPELEALC